MNDTAPHAPCKIGLYNISAECTGQIHILNDEGLLRLQTLVKEEQLPALFILPLTTEQFENFPKPSG